MWTNKEMPSLTNASRTKRQPQEGSQASIVGTRHFGHRLAPVAVAGVIGACGLLLPVASTQAQASQSGAGVDRVAVALPFYGWGRSLGTLNGGEVISSDSDWD